MARKQKNRAAAALRKLGVAKTSKRRRVAIARNAARVRWDREREKRDGLANAG